MQLIPKIANYLTRLSNEYIGGCGPRTSGLIAVTELQNVDLLVNVVSDLEDVDQELPVSADYEMQDVNLM